MVTKLYISSKNIQFGSVSVRYITALDRISLPLSPLEKNLTNAVIYWRYRVMKKRAYCKISLFTHKYQIQGQMKKSLVYVSKAFDHATFSTLKKQNILKS